MHVPSLLLLLLLGLNIAFGLDTARSVKLKKKSFASVVFSKQQSGHRNKTASCEWLHKLKHQSKLCRKRKGLAAVLQNARRLAVKHCEEQFRYSQWNCTQRARFFRRPYRETALMQALSASALTFAVARACREGTLAGCRCGTHPAGTPTTEDGDVAHWGDCSDNVRYARAFARKFLRLRGGKRRRSRKGDEGARLARHNDDLGVRLVANSVEVACRCHGVSGSCAVRICFRKMRPFGETARQLFVRYHSALQLPPATSEAPSATSRRSSRGRLAYLVPGPNFCPLTVGRRCLDPDNCATLCCGRGHFSDVEAEAGYCNCRFPDGSLQLACDTCLTNRTVLRCK